MICCLALFFFFKQKPAYELRISDWSSDVCSSDLHYRFAVAEIPRSAEQQAELPDRRRVDQPGAHRPAGLAMIDALIHRIDDDRGRGEDRREIGRESCRERVRPQV